MSEQFDDKILTRRGFLKAGATLGGMAAMGTMLPAGGAWAADVYKRQCYGRARLSNRARDG